MKKGTKPTVPPLSIPPGKRAETPQINAPRQKPSFFINPNISNAQTTEDNLLPIKNS